MHLYQQQHNKLLTRRMPNRSCGSALKLQSHSRETAPQSRNHTAVAEQHRSRGAAPQLGSRTAVAEPHSWSNTTAVTLQLITTAN